MSFTAVRASVTISAVTLVGLLAGCALQNPFGAGGDSGNEDISVSPAMVGQLAVASMDQSFNYTSSLTPASTATDHLVSEQNAGALSLQKGLAKAGSVSRTNAEEWEVDSSDIANDLLTITVKKDLLGCTIYDTLIVKASNPDNVLFMAETKVCAKTIESLRATDADGNGILAGPAEINGTGTLVASVTYTDDYWGHKAGEVETAVFTASSGPDGDFDTEDDNVIYTASWVRTLAGDTLAFAAYTDADGDGYIIDNAAATPSVVDVTLLQKNPPFNFFVDYSRLYLRIITDGNEENDKVIRLSGEEKLVTGRVNSILVLDTTGDSTIDAGDIAEAIFATVVPSASDSIISSSARVVFDPKSGLENETDNLYYELHLAHEKRFGIVRKLTYDFTTTEPVAEGQKPTSGHIEMFVEYANGKTASVAADFSGGYFTGTYTGPEGNTLTVTWDSDGNVVSQQS